MTTNPPCTKCDQPHPRCTSHNRLGKPCGRQPIMGGFVCPTHGGRAPRVKAAAARRLQLEAATQAAATLGLPIDISPSEALLAEVQWTAGHVAWLRARVQALGEAEPGPEGQGMRHPLIWGQTGHQTTVGGPNAGTVTTQESKPSVWYELYERERRHLVAVCGATLKAGVEARRVQLAEDQGALVARVINAVLGELQLSEAQKALVPVVVPAQLRALAGGAA